MSNPADHKLERDQFTVTITCLKCGQTGHSVWEENRIPSRMGPQPTLISISEGFYERIRKKSPYDMELVCHHCGAVQPD